MSNSSPAELAMTLIQLTNAINDLRHRVGKNYGVTDTCLRAAVRISTNPSMTPKMLAKDLNLTTGAITSMLDQLATNDLATRHAHPDDRRSITITLTDRGNNMVIEELDILKNSVHGDIESLIEVLKQAQSAIHDSSPQRPPQTRNAHSDVIAAT